MTVIGLVTVGVTVVETLLMTRSKEVEEMNVSIWLELTGLVYSDGLTLVTVKLEGTGPDIFPNAATGARRRKSIEVRIRVAKDEQRESSLRR